MTIKINQLKCLVMIVEHGSIRAASRALNISQPAVTRAIKELEVYLGAQIVHRSTQGITLTEPGQQLLCHANLVLRELHLAEESFKQASGHQYGSINIGIGASIACELMPQVIRKFREKYPYVKIKIQEGQLEAHIENLRHGKIDFAINTLQPNMELHDFQREKIMEIPFKLVVRKHHPTLGGSYSIEDLQDYDWVMPTTRSSYLNTVYDALSKHGKHLNNPITCESYLSTLAIISQTDCIGLVSETALEHYSYSSLLDEIPLNPPLPHATYYLVSRRSSQLTPVAQELAQLFMYQARPLFTGREQP
ncbi:LysR substrate-binding domain-containing protein [Celerinatantimonas diazotrophica]|uniref:LysR family transcriptional regulator of abg operon n=1 Tax=Celerinatantimonas diazotrophica TaxID=412034 RepID=A0A4R1J862_9GAMM|nr:LysR substrate-binding domain-containing protein [Celerinatantimonas diazotrophica]TCK46732.1 LysR family transcriptional regulator of abg operon [Celerinatantimonas diazotrophica]CAG9295434.1 HTH-type transcriptional regulator TsaR [Celerinatantimonas diazotrophica]